MENDFDTHCVDRDFLLTPVWEAFDAVDFGGVLSRICIGMCIFSSTLALLSLSS